MRDEPPRCAPHGHPSWPSADNSHPVSNRRIRFPRRSSASGRADDFRRSRSTNRTGKSPRASRSIRLDRPPRVGAVRADLRSFSGNWPSRGFTENPGLAGTRVVTSTASRPQVTQRSALLRACRSIGNYPQPRKAHHTLPDCQKPVRFSKTAPAEPRRAAESCVPACNARHQILLGDRHQRCIEHVAADQCWARTGQHSPQVLG